MTKKNYIMLAELIRINTNKKQTHLYINSFLEDLCCELKKDNPNFNIERFLNACN